MSKPVITSISRIPMTVKNDYEKYIPTAFDESFSLLEKVNKVIHYLNQIGALANGVSEKWNEVLEWVMSEGLEESVSEQLQEWFDTGIINELLEEEVNNYFERVPTQPSLLNGYENYSANHKVQYVRQGNTLHISGIVKNGNGVVNAGDVLFYLPTQYRPIIRHSFVVSTSNGMMELIVDPNSEVKLAAYKDSGRDPNFIFINCTVSLV